MPAYQAEQTLERAVRSVRAQDFDDWELLIVDDGSRDGTAAIAEKLAAEDPRIRVFRLPSNSGAARARNHAIGQAKGRYLAFLDADDEWSPQKLSRQIAFMQQTGTPLCYSGFWRDTGTTRHEVKIPASVTYSELLRGNVIGCLTAVVDRTAFPPGIAMPDIRRRQDYAFWLRLLRDGATARGIAEPLATHHRTPQSLSSALGKSLRATWQVYRQQEGLGRLQSCVYLWSHLFRRLRRG